ncbi:MAG: hypothetical protein DBX41_05505 [Clostridiales bacterium]|nr:MAG: hypothetical protein DBX41_05505 [Clostridiales bacterium]
MKKEATASFFTIRHFRQKYEKREELFMESIKILGKVTLKQVVDDEYKQKASKELQNAIAKVDDELANFDKNMNKTITELTLKAHPQVEQVRRQFNAEREKIAVYKDQLTSSIKAILDLEDGSRVDAGEANFIQELKVGDDFGSTNVEVVIRGDKVIEINHAE